MTEITLHNTRTRQKDRFEPIDPGNVRMYVCGPTVYDRAHIGNARPAVVFDVLARLLRHVYGADHVTYARNITDVDDKIIARARETLLPGESLEAACRRITDETIGWYREDMGYLGVAAPDHEPRCTEYIPQMVAMIGRLVEGGHAYAADGHVLFAVSSYPAYGRLANRSVEEMQAGARVEVAPYKRDAMDFVLWKPSTPDQPGWDSPWGRGRPGWHIECSAMAEALLWRKPLEEGRLSEAGRARPHVFDIHAGGIDLAFPHHENEVAQSCCANHTEVMANFWMHNGFLMVEGEKMSKSLGNFFTVADLREKGIPGEVIRYVLLVTHYRQPLDWTAKRVEDATTVINRWRRALDIARRLAGEAEAPAAVLAGLADDLNTWTALRETDLLAKAVLDPVEEASQRADARAFLRALALLGFDAMQGAAEIAAGRRSEQAPETQARIRALLTARWEARKARDFARADRLRDGLVAAGVVVKDSASGTDWELGADFDPLKLAELEAER